MPVHVGTRERKHHESWDADERVSVIAPKFEGYIEQLHVNATGQMVQRGQALFEAYSPEMLAAQREYVIAAKGVQAMKDAGAEARSGIEQLAESSLAHLRHWDWSSARSPMPAATRDVPCIAITAGPSVSTVVE